MSEKPEKSNNQVPEDVDNESEDEKEDEWDGVERRKNVERRVIAYLQGQDHRKSKKRRKNPKNDA